DAGARRRPAGCTHRSSARPAAQRDGHRARAVPARRRRFSGGSLMRPRILGTAPLFVVADVPRSLAFYCDKLGFREPAMWGEPPESGMINRDHFDLMLSCAETPAHIRPNGPNRVWDMYLRVDDVAAEQRALEAAGVRIDRGPEKTFYDMIEIEVLDLD